VVNTAETCEALVERKPSFAILYFLIGFTASATLTALLLVVLRPVLIASDDLALRQAAMWAPVFIGGIYGLRVAHFGLRDRLTILPALLRALKP
jgi:hypothetical protein